MNGFTRPPWRRIVSSSFHRCALILIGACWLGFERVEAAPIHGDHERLDAHEAALARSGMFRSWSEYLMGGPSVWSGVIHPRVTPAVESAIWKAIRTDPGETSPWVQYLLHKQSLDPARFAHYHPKLSPALDKLSAAPTAAQVLTPGQTTTSTGGTTTSTGGTTTPTGGTTTPLTEGQEIPEPATWLLALGMAGWGVWRRRHPKE